MSIAWNSFTPWSALAFATLAQPQIDAGLPALLAAGFLVGIGTRYGSGCTSGHGVCSISRLSLRSVAATAAFMAAGFITGAFELLERRAGLRTPLQG